MIELRLDSRAANVREAGSDWSTWIENLEATLFDLGAVSVELCDGADQPLLEPPPGTHPLWDAIVIKAHFTNELPAELAAAALAESNPQAPAPTLRAIESRDWIREGLAGLGAMNFGHGLWIVPSWAQADAQEPATIVHLDPGLAFGTGTHPTTALCLQSLAASPPHGQRVLDYGCGSGILAIAAAKLGATTVDAFDIDPQAVTATISNARHNGLEVTEVDTPPNSDISTGFRVGIVSAEAPASLVEDGYDLVVANILARPLIHLAPNLSHALRPGGRILLTGLLVNQANEVMNAYPKIEWHPAPDRLTLDGWILLEGQRKLKTRD
ncbi:MAG: 50S ribosomal protein L11 methyltransferase [Thioalkalivibrionaceae bacterium]